MKLKFLLFSLFLFIFSGNVFCYDSRDNQALSTYNDVEFNSITTSSITFDDGTVMDSTSNFSGAGMYVPLDGSLPMTGTLNGTDVSMTYGIAAATGTFTSGLSVITSTTGSSSPGTLLTFGNSGYAAPSDCNTVSNGDKWIFWNQVAYKGSIGFDTREMYFQSTNNAGSAGKFSFHNGIASAPVELLQFGEANFIWNDTGIDTDFRCESNDDENMFFLDGTANRIGISTGTPTEKFHVAGTIKSDYGITAATGVFSGAVAADEVNASKVNIGANGYMSFVGTSYGLLTANSSKEQLELTLTAQNLGRQLVMGDRASYTLDFDHVPQENPTFYIHSSTSVDYDNSQWVSLAHDKSDAIFGIGKGSYSFTGGSVACQYGIIASSSTITKIINPVSSVQILWSTSSINCDNYNTLVVSSGSIVSVSTITAGVEGQTIKLTGTSDTDIVRFITGGNLKLDVGGSFDVGNADKIWFTYRDLYWEEDNRKNNTF